jgi:hypothetical protein
MAAREGPAAVFELAAATVMRPAEDADGPVPAGPPPQITYYRGYDLFI